MKTISSICQNIASYRITRSINTNTVYYTTLTSSVLKQFSILWAITSSTHLHMNFQLWLPWTLFSFQKQALITTPPTRHLFQFHHCQKVTCSKGKKLKSAEKLLQRRLYMRSRSAVDFFRCRRDGCLGQGAQKTYYRYLYTSIRLINGTQCLKHYYLK